MTKMSILIVNYQTEDYIVNLLNNIQQQTILKSDIEVIIINNTQSDKLSTMVHDHNFLFNINIIQNDRNLGFGVANNIGALSAVGEYLLIINPDISMVESDYLERLYWVAKSNTNYGIISTRVLNQHHEQCGPFYTYPYNKEFKNLPGKITAVIGALMMIKRDLYLQVNGFDEDYFLYEEDIDLCLRIRQIGFEIFVYSELFVLHIGGVSERDTKMYDYQTKKRYGVYLFCLKHYTQKEFKKILFYDVITACWQLFLLLIRMKIFKNMDKINKYQFYLANLHCAINYLKKL